jgi:hypothetical protein
MATRKPWDGQQLRYQHCIHKSLWITPEFSTRDQWFCTSQRGKSGEKGRNQAPIGAISRPVFASIFRAAISRFLASYFAPSFSIYPRLYTELFNACFAAHHVVGTCT